MSEIDVQLGRLDERLKALDRKVDEKFKDVIESVTDLSNGLVHRVERLEAVKLSASDFVQHKEEQAPINRDFETRLRFIERYLWAAMGILALFQFLGFGYLIAIIK